MLRGWLNRSRHETPSTGASLPEAVDLSGEPPDDVVDPVSDVLRRTDVWFAYRVSELENIAKELASSHAAVGQPRHDSTPTAPLHMEVLLANRGTEVLHNWADRVRVRMQGAMEREVEGLGACMTEAREAVANAASARASIDSALDDLEEERRSAAAKRQRQPVSQTITVERHLGRVPAASFLVLLVLADLFANLPVFVELLPTDSQLSRALQEWGAGQLSAGLTASYGARNLWYSVTAHPEPAILALSVIVFFLLLGHKLGTYLRRLVALWSSTATVTHWREAVLPTFVAAIGIVLTVTFLFGARARIEPLTQERYQAAEQRVREVSEEIQSLEVKGEEVPANLFEQRASAEQELKFRRDRRDYGSTISAVNVPILSLNLVLVLAAAMIGYATAEGTFSGHSKSEDEDLGIRLQEDLARSRSHFGERRRHAYEVIRPAMRVLIRIEHLGRADVLKDFEAKKARVSCAIPLFRSENARLRSLDVTDIAAFRTPADLVWPTFQDVNLRVDVPAVVDELRSELHDLEDTLRRLDDGWQKGRSVRSGGEEQPSEVEPLSLIAGGR